MEAIQDVDRVLSFEPNFATSLPETYALMLSANLIVHPHVSRVILHGSRGLKGGFRSDSDVDLSLIVDLPRGVDIESDLCDVVKTTLAHWRASVVADLAVIFDLRNCGLKCFDQITWNEQICQSGGTDCFGLYKIQKGFQGLVTLAGIRVKLMYPCLKLWQRR
jgi:hypothetical protein